MIGHAQSPKQPQYGQVPFLLNTLVKILYRKIGNLMLVHVGNLEGSSSGFKTGTLALRSETYPSSCCVIKPGFALFLRLRMNQREDIAIIASKMTPSGTPIAIPIVIALWLDCLADLAELVVRTRRLIGIGPSLHSYQRGPMSLLDIPEFTYERTCANRVLHPTTKSGQNID